MTIDGTLNIPTIITIITICIGAVMWLSRLESRVNSNSQQGDNLGKKIEAVHGMAVVTREQLSEYKTHVAETYVSKKGQAEQTDMIMKAILEVGTRMETRVDGLGARLDRFYEGGTPQPRSRRNTGSN